ncbi:pyruvate dehydrogenase (acetyl-transferring) E1 component subunit alpha [Candidatus Woesearchaeota archaeon]|nr:pyruvate dehydrogenase (acetyl-transferring) E1 component subunit alpha [Candidatus Woesearchaeota archaeon]
MPTKEVGRYSVTYLQILDESGIVDKELEPVLTKDQLLFLYKTMVQARKLDAKMISMQRQGRLGTFAPVKGQEASQVASAMALDQDDWMFPAFREAAAYLARGTDMKGILLYNRGSEEGNRTPQGQNNFMVAIPVASQIPHAVGCAMAMTIKKEQAACLVYFGDGATSEGDFHESLNFAGVYKAPVVFLCQNNQWAISVPRQRQTASATLAQKAIAYGFAGIQVDGNDALAVYAATKNALDKAKQGGGPTLIECITYRMEMHTTADDPSKYRSDEEVKAWEAKDPIKRFKVYLQQKNLWDERQEAKLQQDVDAEIEKAVQDAEAVPKRRVDEMFNYTFAELSPRLQEERDTARRYQIL